MVIYDDVMMICDDNDMLIYDDMIDLREESDSPTGARQRAGI